MSLFTTYEFEQSFKRYYKPLCLFALRYTGGLDDAEDIVQQVFADVWEKNKEGTAILHLKQYLYQAVRNRCLTWLLQQEPQQSEENPPEPIDTSVEEQIQVAERDARLWDSINQLPTERRRIFLLSKRDGLKYSEIAEELGISIKTVENQMSKALKSLREVGRRLYLWLMG